jgi:hypothetical protein
MRKNMYNRVSYHHSKPFAKQKAYLLCMGIGKKLLFTFSCCETILHRASGLMEYGYLNKQEFKNTMLSSKIPC